MQQRFRRRSDFVSAGRLNIISSIFLFFFVAVIIRLFFIQVIAHEHYQDLADSQQQRSADFVATRGDIYARDHTNEGSDELYPLAVNKIFYEVFLNPDEVTRPINTAQSLSDIIGLEYDSILARAKKENDIYEPVTMKASEEQVQELKDTGLSGIYWRENMWRFYPDAEVGSHILGFYGAGDDGKVGKYGVEGYWQDELAGSNEESMVTRDGTGQMIPSVDGTLELAVDGSDLILTIDRTIQFEVCRILKEGIERYAADKGTVIIMESTTGKIRSLCNYPAFDPNEYQEVEDVGYFNNDAVFEAYEPGSVFKPISMAIAIDQGKVTPTTIYEDEGEIEIGEFTIHNFDNKAHGVKTMTEVLQESLNLGAIFATKDVSNRIYYDYIKKFGFGEKTNIELSQEVDGNLGKLETAKDIYKATSSYGQGLTVTPLQMLAAINVLANDGILVRPYIVEEVRKTNGDIVESKPQDVRRVLKKDTAQTVSAMLVQVAEEGYDYKASVPGYYVAGKTGTAQIAERGKYGDKTNHTFVGFGPAADAKFAVIIKLHNVKNVTYASDSTTPLFSEIANFLLRYYKIPPNR